MFCLTGYLCLCDRYLTTSLQGESHHEKHSSSPILKNVSTPSVSVPSNDHVKIPTDGDVWEINASLLKFENKVASGTFGDL